MLGPLKWMEGGQGGLRVLFLPLLSSSRALAKRPDLLAPEVQRVTSCGASGSRVHNFPWNSRSVERQPGSCEKASRRASRGSRGSGPVLGAGTPSRAGGPANKRGTAGRWNPKKRSEKSDVQFRASGGEKPPSEQQRSQRCRGRAVQGAGIKLQCFWGRVVRVSPLPSAVYFNVTSFLLLRPTWTPHRIRSGSWIPTTSVFPKAGDITPIRALSKTVTNT